MLGEKTLIDVNYLGNKGTRLSGFSTTMQQLDLARYMPLGNALLDNINLHPEIPKPYASYTGTVAQALRYLPQYRGASYNNVRLGSSSYNTLQATITRRVSSGLSVFASYAYAKTLTNASGQTVQDVNNARLARGLANFNYPHELKITWVFDLPFGKGQRFLNQGGILNAIVGNWSLTGIQQYRSGDSLALSTSISTSNTLFNGGILPDIVPDVPLKLDAGGLDFKNGTQYLNPAAFVRPPTTSRGVPMALGNAPTRLTTLRSPMYKNEDLGILKKFPIAEKREFVLRADMFKALNRTLRGTPETNLDSPLFGKITTIAGPTNPLHYGPRVLQIEARFNFSRGGEMQ
jgi:hypothetical protein